MSILAKLLLKALYAAIFAVPTAVAVDYAVHASNARVARSIATPTPLDPPTERRLVDRRARDREAVLAEKVAQRVFELNNPKRKPTKGFRTAM